MAAPLPKFAMLTYLVPDYDQAISWLQDGLGFKKCKDEALEHGKRWVEMAPAGGGTALLVAKATTPLQQAAIGQQAGDRVFCFYHTDQFDRDYKRLQDFGIRFTETPRDEVYGKVVVFLDPYGNKWDLIEPK